MFLSRVVRSLRRNGAVTRSLIFTLLGLGVAIAVVSFWRLQNQPKPIANQDVFSSKVDDAKEQAAKTPAPRDWVVLGGVERPSTDVKRAGKHQGVKVSPKKPEGAASIVPKDANDQVKMVHEALQSDTNPERYSSFVVKRSFDEDAFKANPAKYATEYAKIVEPGRVFAPAQPKNGVKALRSASERIQIVKQGESVRLAVVAAPNAPVTFTSFGMGQFDNSLSSTTVVADADGKAQAAFTATGGTRNEVKILAASPLLAEQVAFTVSVRLPASIETL